MSSPRPPHSQLGAVSLPSSALDAPLARRRLEDLEAKVALAGVAARRKAGQAWRGFDRRMEESDFMGRGQDGALMDFTTVDAGSHRVQVLKSQLAHSPPLSHPLTPSLSHSSTPSLRSAVALHEDFARRYAKYAAADARQAVRQAGMAVRDEAEVGRRAAVERLEGGEYSSPSSSSSSRQPSSSLASARKSHRLEEGLEHAADVALDVGIGVEAARWEEKRRRREKREEVRR
ncbi:hypothetical protein JCM8097_006950 [Rhodosporidiobolus ruineniae]